MARRTKSGDHSYSRTGKLRGSGSEVRYAVIVQGREHTRIAGLRPDGTADAATERPVPTADVIDIKPTRVVPTGQRRTITLPGEFCRDLGIEEGTPLQITQEEDGLLIIKPLRRVVAPDSAIDLKALLDRITPENLPDDDEFDTGRPVGREIW